jgi:hypothetical protein
MLLFVPSRTQGRETAFCISFFNNDLKSPYCSHKKHLALQIIVNITS